MALKLHNDFREIFENPFGGTVMQTKPENAKSNLPTCTQSAKAPGQDPVNKPGKKMEDEGAPPLKTADAAKRQCATSEPDETKSAVGQKDDCEETTIQAAPKPADKGHSLSPSHP
jgi:hypothetical protein